MALAEGNFWIRAFLVLVLIYLAYVDLRTFRLPNAITLPLIISGILFNQFSEFRFTDPSSAFIGAITGYLFLWILNLVYKKLKKQDGIGMGDAKLFAGLGAWLGWATLPSTLFIASVSGLIGGLIWLKWNNQHHRQAFPFGPFLAIAGIIQLLCPQLLPTLLLSNLN